MFSDSGKQSNQDLIVAIMNWLSKHLITLTNIRSISINWTISYKGQNTIYAINLIIIFAMVLQRLG